ncbi:MAG: ORF6N domain-containing protein [Bacteroidetes bacterium]|nr:ORF6N domain-containing protein [Bacteroidota bacterium]
MSCNTIKIYKLRGQNVMLDFDLAELYATETKYLKRAVKSNQDRFPPDLLFELMKQELETLRCRFSTSKQRGGIRYLVYAFTEQGVAMLSSVLKSKKAIEVNIAIMRAFVFIRQYALSHQELTQKLKALENKYNTQFKDVYEALNYLIKKDKMEVLQKERKRIGFKT